MKRRLLCRLGWHNFKVEQETVLSPSTGGQELTIAWKCCKHCYASKLIHILNGRST